MSQNYKNIAKEEVAGLKKLSKRDDQYLEVISLRNRGTGNPIKDLTQYL